MSETLDSLQNSLSDILPQLGSIIGQFFSQLAGIVGYFFSSFTDGSLSFGQIYTGIIRWVMPLLALHILITVLRSMLRVRNPKETWGYLLSPDLGKFSINHWECTVGRAKHCDVRIKLATVSKTQCALIRNDEGEWRIHNLSDKNITCLNGEELTEDRPLRHGDTVTIGGADLRFEAITELEYQQNTARRIRKSKPLPPWTSFVYITVFQFLTVIQLFISKPEIRQETAISYGILCAVMWIYVLVSRSMGKTGFEPEILAFFACSLNLAITATALQNAMYKQTISILLGILLFTALGLYLRDLDRVIKTRHFMAAAAIVLLLINIVFSEVSHGARNWITIFGMSLQPSELTKICFIFAGAAALDRLFEKRNLIGFMCLSGFCLLSLAIMSDFGTAAIFFATFLVIAFLRSGDFATLSLITGGAVGALLLVLRFKPYVAERFAVWGHAWEQASDMGYQQVRTMSAAASGGLIGVGSGNGWLHTVAASETDLVFGVLCEEWGLIIAFLAVMCIVTLCIFAFRMVQTGRSSYYTIAACAATSLLVVQTMLNVFGSVDILPLTGVTFPFISCGGSSMLAACGHLAFLKAADTRQNASFAVKKKTALGELPPDPLYELTDENIPVKKNRGLFRKKKTPEENEREIEEFFSKFENSGEESLPYLDSSPPGGIAEKTAQQEIDDFFSLFDEPTADGTPKDRSEAGSPDPFTPEDYGAYSGFANPDESGADLSRTGIYDRKNFTGGYSNGHDYDRDWRDDE